MSPIIKKEKEGPKLPSKYVLLIFTILSVILMILSFVSTAIEGFILNIAGPIVIPFQQGVSAVGGFFVEKAEKTRTIEELTLENEELRQQIDELIAENTMLMQDKYELTNLRELYELDLEYEDYEKVAARIISWDSGNWYSSFLINKGTDDGMQKDMNVIAGSGLVGRITETGQNWSRVTCIIDDNSNVSAYVLHTGDNMVVHGDARSLETGVIPFSNLLDQTNSVAPGDKIVTSYISDKYLPGLLIGYIASVQVDANNLTKTGTLTPVVDFSSLSEVLVILDLKESLQE